MSRAVPKVDGTVAEIVHHGAVAYRHLTFRADADPARCLDIRFDEAIRWMDARFTRASVIAAAKATPNAFKASSFASKRDALVWLARGIANRFTPIEGVTRHYCGAKYWDGNVCASCGEKWDGHDYTEAGA